MRKRFSLLFIVTLLAGCGVDWLPAAGTALTLTSLAVTPATPSIVVTATQQFTATGTYSDNSTKDLTSTVTWTSSVPTVATITTTGALATAIAAGTTKITATSGTLIASTVLTVTSTASQKVSTFAGTSGVKNLLNGTGIAARFNTPSGVTSDGTYLYVADSGNHAIRRIEISTGIVTTVTTASAAGTPVPLSTPAGITTDKTNLYVTDAGNNSILKIAIPTGSSTAGVATTIASLSEFKAPEGIVVIGTDLYVADTGNNTILKVDISTGTVTILAGSDTAGSTDANGILAKFNGPTGITTDGTNLYVVDQGNSTIRKIAIPTGTATTATVTTIAGSAAAGSIGSTDATGTEARFSGPTGIAINAAHTNLYVTDTKNLTIRQIAISSGAVTTIAGTPGGKQLSVASGIVSDGTDLFVTDSGEQTILKLVLAN